MADISKWNNISRSLLLPLYFRAVETEKKNPVIYDEKAKDIIQGIDYDFDSIDGFEVVQTATVMRENVFDRLVFDFLKKNPEAVVINIGSGLDTRFFRMDNGKVLWYELDLPEVIETRKELFSETDRHKFIAASAFDFSWHDKIDKKRGPVLLLAEGFLFYFSRDSVKKFMFELKESFPGAEFFFDVVSPFQAVYSRMNPALNLMDVWFRWGLNCAEELNCWSPDIKTQDVIYYFKPSFERLGWYAWYSMLPAVRFGFYIITCVLGR